MKQHILVVDDEPQIRDLFCIYLRKHGFDVSTTTASEDTLRVVETQPIDLIVLDINLDNEDGLRLLKKIKAAKPSVRVVMLTGMGFVEDLIIDAQKNGADGYVSKALPMDELLREIERVLRPAAAA